MLIHIWFELFIECSNNVIIHKAALICNSSAAVTPYNYKQTDTYILFLAKI